MPAVTVGNPDRASDLALAWIARPLLFGLWVFFLWGTLYAAALAYAVVVEGADAWRRPLSGDDPVGGMVSLVAAAVAIVAWAAIAVLFLLDRKRRGTPHLQA